MTDVIMFQKECFCKNAEGITSELYTVTAEDGSSHVSVRYFGTPICSSCRKPYSKMKQVWMEKKWPDEAFRRSLSPTDPAIGFGKG